MLQFNTYRGSNRDYLRRTKSMYISNELPPEYNAAPARQLAGRTPQLPPDPLTAEGYASTRRPLTFRSSKIIYYGPHACANCGVMIAKMGHEFGGNAFTYPEGPIYPNTEWQPHVCDPKLAGKYHPMPSNPPCVIER
jgi:hypothetical protein